MAAPVRLTVKVSEPQREALREVVKRLNTEQSTFVREALRKACEEHGVAWPDDLQPRGKYPRK